MAAWFAALPLAFALGASGCISHHHHSAATTSVHARGHGPPSHAPAHGHRRKQHRDGIELVFDAGLGVWVVVGRPGLYWHGDRYLSWKSGIWRASNGPDGMWVVVRSDRVPAVLVKKHAGFSKKSHTSRPARHAH